MPITLTCPNCSATLTTRQAVPAGKAIACPKCKATFTAPAEAEIPDAVLVDEPPRPKRRDDDGDRPRVRRKRADDEGDDDRHPRRSRRDDDEDDRPARRKKKRLNPLFIILPAAGGVFLLVLGLVLYFFVFSGGGSVPQSDMVAWAPADATTVTYFDYQTLRNHPNVDKSGHFGLGRVPLYGLDPSRVDAVVRTGPFRSVTVVRLKSADAAAIDRAIASQNGQEVKVAGKSTYRTPKATFYRASDRLLVAAEDPEYLAKRIEKDEGKVIISAEMKDFLSRASGTIWQVQVAGSGTMINNGDRIEGDMTCLTLSGGRGEKYAETVYVDVGAASRAADRANAAYGRLNAGEVTRSGRRLKFKGPVEGDISLMEFIHGIW